MTVKTDELVALNGIEYNLEFLITVQILESKYLNHIAKPESRSLRCEVRLSVHSAIYFFLFRSFTLQLCNNMNTNNIQKRLYGCIILD